MKNFFKDALVAVALVFTGIIALPFVLGLLAFVLAVSAVIIAVEWLCSKSAHRLCDRIEAKVSAIHGKFQ